MDKNDPANESPLEKLKEKEFVAKGRHTKRTVVLVFAFLVCCALSLAAGWLIGSNSNDKTGEDIVIEDSFPPAKTIEITEWGIEVEDFAEKTRYEIKTIDEAKKIEEAVFSIDELAQGSAYLDSTCDGAKPLPEDSPAYVGLVRMKEGTDYPDFTSNAALYTHNGYSYYLHNYVGDYNCFTDEDIKQAYIGLVGAVKGLQQVSD